MLKPLEPIRVEVQPQAVVIGGGVAGLKSALELAERGLAVVLVEKSPFLGGQVAQLDRLAPLGETASEIISELAGAVLSIRPSRFTPAPRWRALRAISAISSSKWCGSPPKARPMPTGWKG